MPDLRPEQDRATAAGAGRWADIKKFFAAETAVCKPDCGLCCVSGAYVEAEEAREIAVWICANVRAEDLCAQYRHFDTQPDRCPFLTPEKRCFIYPVRPVTCRFYGHLRDTPGMPACCSQECPEKVPFTLYDTEQYLDLIRPWFHACVKSHLRIRDFRESVAVDINGKEIAI